MRTKRILALGIIFLLLGLVLFATNPDNLPLPLLILPFILLFLALYLNAQIVLSHIAPNLRKGARHALSMTLAALPVLLLILQSISQLTARDLLITGGLISLLVFYFRKTDFLG